MSIMNHSRLSAAILAGGRSSRFGEQKPFATLHNKKLIDYAVNTAYELSEDVMLITDIEMSPENPDVRVYADMIPHSGPLGGIHTALIHAKQDWTAVLPCDMPLLSSEIYSLLFKKRKNKCPVSAVSSKGVEPLVSIWPSALEDAVKKIISSKTSSVQHALENLNAVYVPMMDFRKINGRDPFININFKEDLESIEFI